jgi:hypothetical protein
VSLDGLWLGSYRRKSGGCLGWLVASDIEQLLTVEPWKLYVDALAIDKTWNNKTWGNARASPAAVE